MNDIDAPGRRRATTALPIDVISIQSQLVYGSVGNSIAVPTLQRMGLHVASVPTVLLSNTPHYPSVDGGVIPATWFAGYLRELELRGVLQATRAIVIGYLGCADQARMLAGWLAHVHEHWPDIRFYVDPVLGDYDCGMYVEPELVLAYTQHLLPLAHGLTPNGFELARLAARRLATFDDVIDAARVWLAGRAEWVVVTSAQAPGSADAPLGVAIVTRDDTRVLTHPRIACNAKGTGDLFAAVLTGLLLADVPLHDAVQLACDEVTSALQFSHQSGYAELSLNYPSRLGAPHPLWTRPRTNTGSPSGSTANC
ncbi:pyridoxine/pyridoxal/pyridoxamine kinase [Jeongeupia naejangsanensis]|uniref:pyridoxal kinase n=1 Tax=Jeongeupia naejangsanensis TaxID=613195 RepID=A0ABS2BN07_9NEIS|nr:pyridoxine/pyridoxal/pyridoxamine kinase [Jeongeupia naejangsanensis]MBM3116810.1 pyridoxine/pyridoxal/pyridoxamine kinase [Jeongeupia naejangsanensis]